MNKNSSIKFNTDPNSMINSKGSLVKIILGLLVVLLFLAAGYIYKLAKDNNDLKNSTPAEVSKQQETKAKEIVNSLSQILYIDETETPTIATVIDPEKLKEAANKDFYKNVQKNDVLVVYPKRAIVYRESENKIINIAPIISPDDISQATQSLASSSAEATPTQQPTVSSSKTTKK